MTRASSQPWSVWVTGGLLECVAIRDAFAAPSASPDDGAAITITVVCDTALPVESADQVIAVLGKATWERARLMNKEGPPPLRDISWPWGFPWLSQGNRKAVEAANDELRHAIFTMETARARSPSVHLSLFAPEDLGITDQGRPASLWQLVELSNWAQTQGMHRAAFWLCSYGRTERPQPTGCLLSHVTRCRRLRRGWPSFRGENRKYAGPLEDTCRCKHEHVQGPSVKSAPQRTLSLDFVRQWIKQAKEDSTESATLLLRSGESQAQECGDPESSEETWYEESAEQSCTPGDQDRQLDSAWRAAIRSAETRSAEDSSKVASASPQAIRGSHQCEQANDHADESRVKTPQILETTVTRA